MTWPFAIFACFSVLVISVVTFLTVVYLKEYAREEKLFKQFAKSNNLEKSLSEIPVLVVQPPPVKKKTTTATVPASPISKSKKDVN